MAQTDVSICSRALVLLGASPISSLNDPESDPSIICGQIYPGLRDDHLSGFPWRFASNLRELTREAGTPDSAWEFSFLLPNDRASHGSFGVYQSGAVRERPFAEWTIIGKRLYANVEEVWIDYTRQVSEEDFPFYFVAFLEAALAAMIAFPVTDQQNTASFWHKVAFGTDPDVPGGKLLTAMQIDAQQFPARSFDVPWNYDLIAARFG